MQATTNKGITLRVTTIEDISVKFTIVIVKVTTVRHRLQQIESLNFLVLNGRRHCAHHAVCYGAISEIPLVLSKQQSLGKLKKTRHPSTKKALRAVFIKKLLQLQYDKTFVEFTMEQGKHQTS